MNPSTTISRNYPWADEYDEESFLGCLYEMNVWNKEEYWLLETALYQLNAANAYDEEITWRVFKAFSSCFKLISAHFDTNDVFKIKNLSVEEVYDYRERVELVFGGYFRKKMPSQDIFDLVNPILGANFG